MKVRRKIRRDSERNENVRQMYNTGGQIARRIEWNQYIGRMNEDIVVRVYRDNTPKGRRTGCQRKKRRLFLNLINCFVRLRKNKKKTSFLGWKHWFCINITYTLTNLTITNVVQLLINKQFSIILGFINCQRNKILSVITDHCWKVKTAICKIITIIKDYIYIKKLCLNHYYLHIFTTIITAVN